MKIVFVFHAFHIRVKYLCYNIYTHNVYIYMKTIET